MARRELTARAQPVCQEGARAVTVRAEPDETGDAVDARPGIGLSSAAHGVFPRRDIQVKGADRTRFRDPVEIGADLSCAASLE